MGRPITSGADPSETGDDKGGDLGGLVEVVPGAGVGSQADSENLEVEGPDDPVRKAFSVEDETSVVQLFRRLPTHFRGEEIRGYCDDLSSDDSLNTIKRRFGGGTFHVLRRSIKSGKILWAQVFKIAGPPVLSPSSDGGDAVPLASAPADKNTLTPGPGATVDLGGVTIPLTGDLAELQKMILYVKAIKTVFPDPPDYNAALLEALLNRNQPDPLELLGKLRQAVPEVFGGGSDGDGGSLYAVLQEAIKQAGSVLSGMRTPSPMPGRLPMPAARVPAPSTPSLTEPEPGKAPESEAQPVSLSPQQMAVTAVSEIVKAFGVEPPQKAADVVAGLDLVFQVSPADRSKIKPFKGALQAMAVRNLGEYFDPIDADTVARFEAYFSEVFDLFTDETRRADL